jgi:hypothetical protein
VFGKFAVEVSPAISRHLNYILLGFLSTSVQPKRYYGNIRDTAISHFPPQSLRKALLAYLPVLSTLSFVSHSIPSPNSKDLTLKMKRNKKLI